jgi:hypothetical protein
MLRGMEESVKEGGSNPLRWSKVYKYGQSVVKDWRFDVNLFSDAGFQVDFAGK